MKKYTILLFLLLPFCLLAQSSQEKETKAPRVFLSLEFGMARATLNLDNEAYLDLVQNPQDIQFRGETHQTYGLKAGWKLNSNIDLLSGFSYQKTRFVQYNDFDFWRCDPTDYGATRIVNADRKIEMTILSIPVEARYTFQKGKFSFYPLLGLGFNIFSNKKESVDLFLDNEERVDHPNNQNDLAIQQSVHISLQSRFGVRYALNSKFSVKIEPGYTYYFGEESILSSYEQTTIGEWGVYYGFEYLF